jgi:hypothetical protein
MLGTFWIAVQLFASKEALSCTELVSLWVYKPQNQSLICNWIWNRSALRYLWKQIIILVLQIWHMSSYCSLLWMYTAVPLLWKVMFNEIAITFYCFLKLSAFLFLFWWYAIRCGFNVTLTDICNYSMQENFIPFHKLRTLNFKSKFQ